MAMYGVLEPKSDVGRLYIKRKGRSRGLVTIKCCVREEGNSLGIYVDNFEENSSGDL